MIKKVFIWSKWLRLIHGVFILSFITLSYSGWAFSISELNTENNLIVHQLASVFIAVALFIRLVLLVFGKSSENIKSFFDQGEKLKKITALVGFYLTLGKLPLPNWFSKSALWAILYLVFFVLILSALITGLLLTKQDMIFDLMLVDFHEDISWILFYLVIFHVITAIWHDVSSENNNISAILNGVRIFNVEERQEATEQKITFNKKLP